jgi:multicomponent Na+:H+ antiporter subunit E
VKPIKARVINFVFTFSMWMLLTRADNWPAIVVGLIVAGVVSLSTGGLSGYSPKLLEPRRYLYFLYFGLVFIWECIKANIDVARRVIMPHLPINPGIVKVKTRLKTEIGLTSLANSITLTPGTFTVDIDPEEGYLFIHWIDVRDEDIQQATEIIVKLFEDILIKVFE